jgi:hypothetical protein
VNRAAKACLGLRLDPYRKQRICHPLTSRPSLMYPVNYFLSALRAFTRSYKIAARPALTSHPCPFATWQGFRIGRIRLRPEDPLPITGKKFGVFSLITTARSVVISDKTRFSQLRCDRPELVRHQRRRRDWPQAGRSQTTGVARAGRPNSWVTVEDHPLDMPQLAGPRDLPASSPVSCRTLGLEQVLAVAA